MSSFTHYVFACMVLFILWLCTITHDFWGYVKDEIHQNIAKTLSLHCCFHEQVSQPNAWDINYFTLPQVMCMDNFSTENINCTQFKH